MQVRFLQGLPLYFLCFTAQIIVGAELLSYLATVSLFEKLLHVGAMEI